MGSRGSRCQQPGRITAIVGRRSNDSRGAGPAGENRSAADSRRPKRVGRSSTGGVAFREGPFSASTPPPPRSPSPFSSRSSEPPSRRPSGALSRRDQPLSSSWPNHRHRSAHPQNPHTAGDHWSQKLPERSPGLVPVRPAPRKSSSARHHGLGEEALVQPGCSAIGTPCAIRKRAVPSTRSRVSGKKSR
jgi:hypothetical protein